MHKKTSLHESLFYVLHQRNKSEKKKKEEGKGCLKEREA